MQPEAGLLALFPPFLDHHVMETRGDAARVSMSFNLRGNWSALGRATAAVPPAEAEAESWDKRLERRAGQRLPTVLELAAAEAEWRGH